MPSLQAYQFRMPAGFAGDLQRAELISLQRGHVRGSLSFAGRPEFVVDCVDIFCFDGSVGRLASDGLDRKSTRLNSSHQIISYAVFCLKKKKQTRSCIFRAEG